ncbi:MAG TPA: hypothetical protein VNX21_05035 [Candidatus Thermoplasmatota archaeon]|nr:hypothetical protein [Candidatus Thermoplasmatota archaeon]
MKRNVLLVRTPRELGRALEAARASDPSLVPLLVLLPSLFREPEAGAEPPEGGPAS